MSMLNHFFNYKPEVLALDEKDAISHRGNALAELEKQLPSFLGE